MEKRSLQFFRGVILLIGIGALAFMLWEPHLEGRNVHSTLFEIYFNDPFLAYAYIASIPFFVALYHAFMAVGYTGHDTIDLQLAVNSLRMIKYCAIVLIGFVAAGEIYILLSPSDDRAGGVFMGILITVGSLLIAAAASTFERKLRRAAESQSMNSLTRERDEP
ncbi:MAG: DUF2975 domain-containing protein [Bacteroidota bacterium]|jgi:hypothetical protein